MWADTSLSCERCPEVSLDVEPTTVDGEEMHLCPECSRRVTLGGASHAQ